MATKTKLERAVEKRATALPEAQRAIVIDQLAVYKGNKDRIAEIDDALRTSNRNPSEERSRLCTERNQLTIANSEITSKLFGQLEG